MEKLNKAVRKNLIMTFLLGLCCIFIAPSLQAGNKKKIEVLQNKIDNLQSQLHHAQRTQTEVSADLQTTEIHIGSIAAVLSKTQTNLNLQQHQLTKLNQQRQQYQTQLQTQRQELAAQLRASYMLGNQDYFKLLLSQQDPSQYSRTLTYLRLLNQQRLQSITTLNQTLLALQNTQQQIQQHTKQLINLQQQIQNQDSELEKTKKIRQQLLQHIHASIQTEQQQLTTLTANKRALERVVQRLSSVSHYFHFQTVSPHPGARFPWPTQGRVKEAFGARIEDSQLRSSGVVLAAPEGQTIYAIAPGQVVYANWMAGYGLLLIINHGNGYMSIYGRNHALYTKVGAIVKSGEPIASVGNSGGYTTPGLYFALRYKGKAIDPGKWCG